MQIVNKRQNALRDFAYRYIIITQIVGSNLEYYQNRRLPAHLRKVSIIKFAIVPPGMPEYLIAQDLTSKFRLAEWSWELLRK